MSDTEPSAPEISPVVPETSPVEPETSPAEPEVSASVLESGRERPPQIETSFAEKPKPTEENGTAPENGEKNPDMTLDVVGGKPVMVKEEKEEQETKRQGKLIWSIFSMIMTTCGIGILFLPYTFAMSGVVSGVILLLVCGIITDMVLCMLVRLAAACQKFSYEEVAEHYLTSAGLLIVGLVVIIDLLSSSLSNMMIFYQSIIQVARVRECPGSENWKEGPKLDNTKCDYILTPHLLLGIALVVFLPMLLLKSVHSLRHTSTVAFFTLMTSIMILFVFYGWLPTISDKDLAQYKDDFFIEKDLFSTSHWTVSAGGYGSIGFSYMFGMAFLCFICQFQIFYIYQELEDRSQIYNVIHITILGFATPVYIAFGLCGYLLLGDWAARNDDGEFNDGLIFNRFTSFTLGQVVTCVLGVTSMFKLPLVFNACRDLIQKLLGIPDLLQWRIVQTLIMLIILYITAIYAKISQVQLFTGAITGSTLGFIFPGIMYLRYVKFYGFLPIEEQHERRMRRAIRDVEENVAAKSDSTDATEPGHEEFKVMMNPTSSTPTALEEEPKPKKYKPSNYNTIGARLRAKFAPKPTDWVHTTVPFETPSKQVYFDRAMPIRSKQQFFLAIFMIIWGLIGAGMSFYGACVDVGMIGPFYEVKARHFTDNDSDMKLYNTTSVMKSTWSQEGWNAWVEKFNKDDWKVE